MKLVPCHGRSGCVNKLVASGGVEGHVVVQSVSLPRVATHAEKSGGGAQRRGSPAALGSLLETGPASGRARRLMARELKVRLRDHIEWPLGPLSV